MHDTTTDGAERANSEAEMVFVATSASGGKPTTIHTDRSCDRLKSAKNIRASPRDAFPEASVCKYCTGDVDLSGGGGNRGPWQALEAMTPTDLATEM